jgi:cupin fold WbuC family metalloprotein
MNTPESYPKALPSPQAACIPMTVELIDEALEHSRQSPRGRIILPLHKSAKAAMSRMLNAIQPGSYIRPHRHAADRAESVVVLRGAILFLVFSSDGQVTEHYRLAAGSDMPGIDFEGGVWHSFLALEPDTVLFEVKAGPYDAATDKEFAPWAPEEGSEGGGDFLDKLQGSH